jgi:hypothetical protein
MNQLNKSNKLNKHLNLVAELFLHDMIRKENPEWVSPNGECKKCEEYYDSLLNAVVVK